MKRIYIKCVYFLGQRRKNDRMIKVKLSNGAVVKIVACWESWEQYSATVDEKRVTLSIAERFNDWLHGGKFLI